MKVKENTQKSGLSAKNVNFIEPWLIEVHTGLQVPFDPKIGHFIGQFFFLKIKVK